MVNNFERRIGKLLEIGLESDDIIGYHGTAVDSVMRMSQTGRLPPGRIDGYKIFFVPLEHADGDYGHADAYSCASARTAYVFNAISCLDEDYQDIWSLDILYREREGDEEDYAKLLEKVSKKYNTGPNELERILDAAGKTGREGCILTLSREIAKDFDIQVMPAPRNNPADNTYIEVGPTGLHIKYITGIEPLSQYEWGILQKFQVD